MSRCRIQVIWPFLALFGSLIYVNALASDDLHVPSPDWREQIIYFAMNHRFNNGDPTNKDQGAGKYEHRKGRKKSGGN